MDNYTYKPLVLSDKKVKLTGRILTFFSYQNAFRISGDRTVFMGKPDEVEKVKLTPAEILKKSDRRARTALIDSVNSNAWVYKEYKDNPYIPKFLTLTTQSTADQYHNQMQRVSDFIKKINHHIGHNLAYSAVAELTKETKLIHFHVVLYNCPFIPQAFLQKQWGHIVDIRKIDRVRNVGRYMAKYMTKQQGLHLRGRKRFFQSQQLKKAFLASVVEVVNDIREYVTNLPSRSWSFVSVFLGVITVEEYDIGTSSRFREALEYSLTENVL